MCVGRARFYSDVSVIKVAFRIPPEQPTPNGAPSWNLAPTDPSPVVPLSLPAFRHPVKAAWSLRAATSRPRRRIPLKLRESTRSAPPFGKVLQHDCHCFEYSRTPYCRSVGLSRVQALLGKGAIRYTQFSEDVHCGSTNSRIMRGREVEGFVEHLATTEPLQGRHRHPIAEPCSHPAREGTRGQGKIGTAPRVLEVRFSSESGCSPSPRSASRLTKRATELSGRARRVPCASRCIGC
jgi:hypothetical protein